MIYLVLAIMASSTIAILFKISEGGVFNRYRVTSANYLMAFLVSLLTYCLERRVPLQVDFKSVLGIGIPAGVFFFLSFVFYQVSVKESGASIAAMFGKLGILLPMVLSVLFWKEFPTGNQWIGILLALLAIVIISSPEKISGRLRLRDIKWPLIGLFMAGGTAEFSNKLFQKWGQVPDKGLFLFVVFFIAFLVSLIPSMRIKSKADTKLSRDIMMGVSVGIPNLLSSYFLIGALESISATVVFPIYSIGSIVTVTLLSRLFFKEHLSRKAIFGIGLTLVALLLI